MLTRDVRDARERARDATLPEMRRARLLEMADAMDMFCQGVDGEMFDRSGTPWPEADITIVDLATFAREGYNAQPRLPTSAHQHGQQHRRARPVPRPADHQRDGRRPHHHEEPAARALRGQDHQDVAQARRLVLAGATQNLDDLPKAAEPMLNMIEWWICLSMPPDEVEKIARFRELNASQKALMLSRPARRPASSARASSCRSRWVLFRACRPASTWRWR